MTKPLISRNNQKISFAEEHVVWRAENWSIVHFGDESKFNLFGSDGNILFDVNLGDDQTLSA